MAVGSAPNSRRLPAPARSCQRIRAVHGVPGTVSSGHCGVSGCRPPGRSFNVFGLQVCSRLGFGCTGEGAHPPTRPEWPPCGLSAERTQAGGGSSTDPGC